MNQGKRTGGAVASCRRGAAGLWSQRFTRRPAPEAEAASASRPRQTSARTSSTHLASTNSCSGGRRSASPSGSHGAASLRRTTGSRQASRFTVAVVAFDELAAPGGCMRRRKDGDRADGGHAAELVGAPELEAARRPPSTLAHFIVGTSDKDRRL